MGDRRISCKPNKRTCAQLVRYPGIHECTRVDGTNREITRESLRKQSGKNNHGS